MNWVLMLAAVSEAATGVAFIAKIVTPVLNEMFESGTIQ
jgi:hypothetical protein